MPNHPAWPFFWTCFMPSFVDDYIYYVFSKNLHISIPPCSLRTFHAPSRDSLFPSLWSGLWLLWAIECDKNDTMWPPNVGHKRNIASSWLSVLKYFPYEPCHHTIKRPGHNSRLCLVFQTRSPANVLANSQALLPDVSEWTSDNSRFYLLISSNFCFFPEEAANIMEQRWSKPTMPCINSSDPWIL